MLLSCIKLFLLLSYANSNELEDKLKEFQSNTYHFYMKHLPKYDEQGQMAVDANLPPQDVSTLADKKIRYRKKYFHKKALSIISRETPLSGDSASEIVGENAVKNIYEIEKLNLRSGQLEASPWSGDYWPIYQGILARRFLDNNFPSFSDWKSAFDYVMQAPFMSVFKSGVQEQINVLAVSEKYDLLVGDQEGTLTKNMWEQGRTYYDQNGKVEGWMGICHGWAAAAIMESRPSVSVEVLAFDGQTKIEFNPSELKGLTSYLWANADYPTRFVGGRCSYKDVKRDENGRPLAPECFDTNPATWFISIVNQIGIKQRGFVMDATADYEVWNQPVSGYQIHYFNPQTLKASETLDDALVERGSFTKDKFKKYRSKKVKQIVGVEMVVTYTVEETANGRKTDSSRDDRSRNVNYTFDLELDAKGTVIGGEWYVAEHPDFLWVPEEGAQAQSPEDVFISQGEWDGYGPMPTTWRGTAQKASLQGRVLNSIASKLLVRAQQQ